jgi:hypothetical protein
MLIIAKEIIRWIGGATLIWAYAMVSLEKMSLRRSAFLRLNLAGSLILAASLAWHHAWPSASVNLIWIGVGIACLKRESLLRQADAAGHAERDLGSTRTVWTAKYPRGHQ